MMQVETVAMVFASVQILLFLHNSLVMVTFAVLAR